ncbi:MAG TPA: uroporphyrinogen-III synthase [Candidatus Tumulicola sp.]|nr:uroporphyrinogen-III synthase [Candidatus Tumulicola sp.]
MDLPLDGVTVLVTRAGEHLSAAALFEALGARVDVAPVIAIGPPPKDSGLQEAVRDADSFDWIVFTSASGVEAFARCRRAFPAKVRTAVVGAATSDALQETFKRRPDVVPERFVSEELAEALRKAAKPGAAILIVQAQDARPVLASRLKEAGFLVTAVAGYSTLETPPPDLPARVAAAGAIVLASASAVRSLVRGLGSGAPVLLRDKVIACIGPITAGQAKELGIRVDVVPDKSTMKAMAQALCRFYEKKNRG